MRNPKRFLTELLASLVQVGPAYIGSLAGATKGGSRGPVWVDWGGSDLEYPEIKKGQEAADQGRWDDAYKALIEAKEKMSRERLLFQAQLLNNLAVSAWYRGLHGEAREYIRQAARIETPSQELEQAVRTNVEEMAL